MKNRALSFINLVGLSMGISSCILISLYVSDALNFDSGNLKADRIYRLSSKIVSESSDDHVIVTSAPVAPTLETALPGVESVVRFGILNEETTIGVDDRLFTEKLVYSADQSVFDVFTCPMVAGVGGNALNEPNKVVLTQSIATKYFGTSDPLGKVISIAKKDHMISGVIKDVPLNSDFRFNMLTSRDTADRSNDDWFDFSHITYVLFDQQSALTPGFVDAFEQKLNVINDDKVNRPLRENKQNMEVTIHLQRLKDLHFQLPLLYDTPKGNIYYTYIFSCVAVLMLLIGCINFVNFSIVQSIERSKEVGIRKVIGAGFYQLVRRYIGESLFFTLIALLMGVIIVIILLPLFNQITNRAFTATDLLDKYIMLSMLLVLLVVGLLAGGYPAFYTSSIKPVLALKGKITTPKGRLIRKMSIASQFFISIGLIICTAIAYRQMNFIRTFDLGFKKENLLVINAPVDSTEVPKIAGIKQQFEKNPAVISVAISGLGGVPGRNAERGGLTLKTDGKDEVRMVNYNFVDEQYLPTLGVTLMAGRNYEGSRSDFSNSILVNEALVRMMGWKKPLEQQIAWNGKFRNVIGVVRDFHYSSLYNQVEPQVLVHHDNRISNLFVKLSTTNIAKEVAQLQESWYTIFPDEPFNYRFVDQDIKAQYESEEKGMAVFTYFSILTIVISCLGLFGVSSLTVSQRKKEIGIRRIIGASDLTIVNLFTKEYVVLITVSIILVSPVAWLLMTRWLESFPYRESIPLSAFLIAGVTVLVISFMTVVFSVMKIASTQAVSLIRES